jgi:hypothetical protein
MQKKKVHVATKSGETLDTKLAAMPRKGLFSAFVPEPINIKFENQEDDEKVLLLLRKHFVTNVPWILISILLILVPFVAPFFPFFTYLPIRYIPIIFIGWYLLVFVYIFENFLLWFYNIYIVTNERVIDVDFYNILYKEVSDARIDKIQDVSYDQNGFVEAFLNYGDILIQTAAEKTEFTFEKVPEPDKVISVINLLLDKDHDEHFQGGEKI